MDVCLVIEECSYFKYENKNENSRLYGKWNEWDREDFIYIYYNLVFVKFVK